MKQTGFMTYAAGALAALGLMALAAPGAWAQSDTDTAVATATAEVVTPIVLTQAEYLKFGSFTAGTGGTVRVPANGGAVAVTSDVLMVHTGNNTAAVAEFTVTGQAGKLFQIIFPTGDTTLTRSGGAETMIIADTTWEDSIANTPGTAAINVNPTVGGFDIGATLTVGSGQVPGVYGPENFTITVTYE